MWVSGDFCITSVVVPGGDKANANTCKDGVHSFIRQGILLYA